MRPDREKIAELLDQIEGELAPSFVEIERYDPSDYNSSFCLDHLLDIDPSLFVETKEKTRQNSLRPCLIVQTG